MSREARARLPDELEPPVALVKRPRLRKQGPVDPGLRPGRGFSLGELREVGLTSEEARRLGLHVDKRRRTVHPWNVEALRNYLEKIKSLRPKQLDS